MTFTSTPPTTPGFYAWRLSEAHPVHACTIQKHGNPNNLVLYMNGELTPSVEIGGQWCKLVPADEIQKAYEEGFAGPRYVWVPKGSKSIELNWNDSRAKRVMEGRV